jgi:hypothetical protein
MSLTRKDAASTVPIALVVLVYLANRGDWSVPLVTANRWAAGAIFVLGMVTCSLGRASQEAADPFVIVLSLLGGAALLLFALALWTGAQWALGLLTLDTVVLWVGATLRHASPPRHVPPHPA